MRKFEIGDLVISREVDSIDAILSIVEYIDEEGVAVLLPSSGEVSWFYHEEVEKL